MCNADHRRLTLLRVFPRVTAHAFVEIRVKLIVVDVMRNDRGLHREGPRAPHIVIDGFGHQGRRRLGVQHGGTTQTIESRRVRRGHLRARLRDNGEAEHEYRHRDWGVLSGHGDVLA